MNNQPSYKDKLAGPSYKTTIESLVEDISQRPDTFPYMYRLMEDEDHIISWHAMWTCEKISERHPDWFDTLYDDLIKKLFSCKHSGSKRLLLSILYNLAIPTPFPVELLNFCMDRMLMPQESIGVQALAVKMAYRLCLKEPELLQELDIILNNADKEFYSRGVKNAIRSVQENIHHMTKTKRNQPSF